MQIIKSIFIIDDDEIQSFVHQKLIYESKIAERVQVFSNATDALNYLQLIEQTNAYYRLFAPQIILLDLHMPIMDGFQFLEAFDKLKVFKRKPIDIFLLSSSVDPMDIVKANSNNNCSGFISKPLSNDKLIKLLEMFSSTIDYKPKVIL